MPDSLSLLSKEKPEMKLDLQYRTAQRFQSKLSLVEPPPEAKNFFRIVESAHGFVA
jgi:hypothetical protein